MKKILFSIVFCFFAQLLYAQKTERRTFSELKGLKIIGEFDIVLESADENFIQIKAENTLTSDKILSTLKGDELTVLLNEKVKPKDAGKITLIVGFKKLKALEITKCVSISAKDGINLDDLEIELSGETQSILALKIKNLVLKLEGKASLKLNGTCEKLKVFAKDDAFLVASDFICEKIEMAVKSKGSFLVHVTQFIDVNLTGVGEVVYQGKPKKIKIEINDGGVVKPLE